MRILSIVKYDFIKLLRNKAALILMIVLPVLVIFLLDWHMAIQENQLKNPKFLWELLITITVKW